MVADTGNQTEIRQDSTTIKLLHFLLAHGLDRPKTRLYSQSQKLPEATANKTSSHFHALLCQLTQKLIHNVLFPIGRIMFDKNQSWRVGN